MAADSLLASRPLIKRLIMARFIQKYLVLNIKKFIEYTAMAKSMRLKMKYGGQRCPGLRALSCRTIGCSPRHRRIKYVANITAAGIPKAAAMSRKLLWATFSHQP